MGKGSAPKPPDPKETAKAQTDSNFATALMNQSFGATNQVTPYGTLSYDQTGTDTVTGADGTTYEVPRYTATTSLSDSQQQLLDTQQQSQQNIANVSADQSGRLGEIFSGPQLASPELTSTYNTDFSADRQRVENALMSRINPSLDRDKDSLRTSLAGQGIREGSEAYDRAMNRFGEQSNDARMQAVLAGGQEQSRMVGLEANRAQFENSAAGQQFNMDATARTQPINEIMALLGGTQVQNPSFVSTPQSQIAGVDVAGLEQANYANEVNAYNQRQQGLGSILGAGATLLGAPSGALIGGLFR